MAELLKGTDTASYQMNLFEFLCYFAMNNLDDTYLLTFCVEMIDFLDLQELEEGVKIDDLL